jgi:uncharacterized protein (TIGR02145 family)
VVGYGGNANGSSMNNTDTNAYYWSSTENDSYYAYFLNFNSYGYVNPQFDLYKCYGRQVRCVK